MTPGSQGSASGSASLFLLGRRHGGRAGWLLLLTLTTWRFEECPKMSEM